MTTLYDVFPALHRHDIRRWSLFTVIAVRIADARTARAVANLDDRLRVDIGLEPLGNRPESPAEAAVRIAALTPR